MIRFAARYYEEDGGWIAEVPALGSGAVTQGGTLEEAREMASEMVSLLLESLVWDHGREGKHLPANDTELPKGYEWICPDPKTLAAISIRGMRKAAGLTMAEASERLGVALGTYQRWESPRQCNARIDTLDRIARTFGRRMEMSFPVAQ